MPLAKPNDRGHAPGPEADIDSIADRQSRLCESAIFYNVKKAVSR